MVPLPDFMRHGMAMAKNSGGKDALWTVIGNIGFAEWI